MTVPSIAELAPRCQKRSHPAGQHENETGACCAFNRRRHGCSCTVFLAQLDPERVCSFLADYIRAHAYAPTLREIAAAMGRCGIPCLEKALSTLESQGKIKRHPWQRGIVLSKPAETPVSTVGQAASGAEHRPLLHSAYPVTVESAIDWKHLAVHFGGVAISRITASQIARYFRKRCVEAGQAMAEREANLLLGFRFPESFLERRAKLEKVSEFMDIPAAKRGCRSRSCGKKFVKVRPSQRYCSARCRRREKSRRRDATVHGKLLKSQQNKRYRQRHRDREQQRKRQWRLDHVKEGRAQREREATRRALNRPWGRKRFGQLPAGIANLRRAAL